MVISQALLLTAFLSFVVGDTLYSAHARNVRAAAPILIEEPEDSLEIEGVIADREQAAFVNALANRTLETPEDGKEEVFIKIDSRGGNVLTGYRIMSIMNVAKYRGYHFTCFVDGDAMSMAFIIFANCDTRYASEFSLLLFHPVRIFVMGAFTAVMARELANDMDILSHEIDEFLMERLEIGRRTYDYHNQRETYWKTSALIEMSPNFMRLGISK